MQEGPSCVIKLSGQSAWDTMLDRLNVCKATVGTLELMLHECSHCVL